MESQPIFEGHGAIGRLSDLGPGLTPEVLVESAWEAYRDYAAHCTLNDPPLTRSFLMWAKTTRGVGDRLSLSNWKRRNPRGYAITVDPTDSIAIVVASGDGITGRKVEGRQPSTSCPKGPATESAVQQNQLTFGDAFPKVQAVGRFQTWILLLHEDIDKQEVRLELSLPAEIADGFVTDWRDRIFLDPIDISSAISMDEGDDDEGEGDIDIPIGRR